MSKNPSALTPEDLANALRAAGSRTVSVDTLTRDIADGAPVNPDGTLNLLTYVAWLLKESANGN